MYKLAVFLLVFASEIISANTSTRTRLSVLKSSELEHWVQNKQWENPLCILFLSKDKHSSKLQSSKDHGLVLEPSILEKTLRKLTKKKEYNGWSFGKVYLKEPDLSSRIIGSASNDMFRCYLGTASPYDYDKKSSIKEWLDAMLTVHKERLKTMKNDDPREYFQQNHIVEISVIVFPGNFFFEVIEKILREVRRSCTAFCRLVIVPPESQQERKLAEEYEIRMYPSILIFHRKRKGIMPVLRKKLQGIHEVNSKENILQAIMVIRLHDIFLNVDNFASNALSSRWKSPLVICFFSSSNPASYTYLNAFHRATVQFSNDPLLKNSVRFGIVDISNPENTNIISRHLDVADIKKIPFIAVLWHPSTSQDTFLKSEIRSKIISDLIPTPWNIEVILRSLGIQNDDTGSRMEEKFSMFCSINSTQSCDIGDYPQVFYGPVWDPSYKPKKAKKRTPVFKKLHGIPLLTDGLWPRIIDQTSSKIGSGIYGSGQGLFKDETETQAVQLVIFIMADCGYCKIMMPSFEKLAKSAKRIHGVSVYFMNCTSDPIQCKANQVTGYPTLALFRSVSEEESKHCVLTNSTSSSIRLDYHGDLQIENILAWLSKAAMSAVRMEIKTKLVTEMKKDVRLTARLYTRNQARKYLSRSLQQKLIPFQCFKLACERLFATVECVARRSTDVETERDWYGSINEKDLIVEKVDFERMDGVNVTVFKMSYPMENTMAEKTGSALHTFHKKHRYSIPGGFKCENDHPLCMHILVRFVEDHLRLPITHITREAFHTQSASSPIFSKEFPLLIALVHKENITTNSSFLKELSKAAKTLYTTIMFATLNVDEFPSWASRFVPRDYHYKNHDTLDKVPALYHYPRLCIIDWNDHQHAAFYPRIEDLERSKDITSILSKISVKDIVNFSEQYLLDRESMSIETEMF